jgi:hypothetical protein
MVPPVEVSLPEMFPRLAPVEQATLLLLAFSPPDSI